MSILGDRRRRIILYVVLFAIVVLGMFYKYYNVFEEIQVKRFFTLLESKKYEDAYRMWQAPPSYKYSDFLEDWGDNGYYAGGPITSFQLESSHSKGNFVLIKILLNGNKEVSLFINKEDKHFSFPP